MSRYVIKRLILMVVTLWVVITMTFVLMHSVPGGPFAKKKRLPPQVIEALNEKYHLNDPLSKQYFDYLKGIMKGDLGPSFKYKGQTVNDFIRNGLPTSAIIGIFSVILAVAIGIPFGVLSALRQNEWEDRFVLIMATLGVCIPSFVLATMMIYIFGLKLGWLPIFGVGSWKSYVLPVIALAGFPLSFLSRLVRSNMVEVLQQDYIRTARAKGLPESVVIFKHTFKNVLIPVVTFLAPMAITVVTGSFAIEKIFALPGMGRYFVNSIAVRDYTVIMGITVFDTILLVIAVFVTDILYGIVDPRIRIYE